MKTLSCSVMISGYPSDLYATYLAGWQLMDVQVNNQACVVTERVWFAALALVCGPGLHRPPAAQAQGDKRGMPPFRQCSRRSWRWKRS